MSNINDTFFDGSYKDIWKAIIPAQLTGKEVEFMLPYFNLKEGDKVLDLMCGYGRHALELAGKGIKVTAVDNLPDYINEIRTTAEKEKVEIHAVQSDVLAFSTSEQFDLVICMGNSINFFNAEDTTRLLKNISFFLKPAGHLLINSWSLAEIVIKNFKERSESEIGDKKIIAEQQFLFHPARLEVKSTFIDKDGNTEIKEGIDYIFSINEMESMLKQAGLELKEVYSIPGRKKFTIGEPRAYLVAEKKPARNQES